MNRNPRYSSRPQSRFDDGRAPKRTPVQRRAPRSRYGAPSARRGDDARHRPMPGRRSARRGWLDRFKTDEVSAIVVNSAVAFVALALLLGLFFLVKPTLDLSRANRLAKSGDPSLAEAFINRLERDGRSPERIEDARARLVERYVSEGSFDAALSLIAQMHAGERVRTLEQQTNYARAAALYAAGDYDAAAQLYYQLGDYEDARGLYAESRCAMAVKAYLEGRENEARYLLLDTDGADARVQAAALAVTGDQQRAGELLATSLFSPSVLQQMARDKQAVSAARQEHVPHRLAAGYRHSVGLRADGTVIAAGDNEKGQCDVAGWADITEVAAGAAHTVGLRRNGTVAATGDNGYGQCDVAEWTGIRSVAACAYGTFGLRSDGTVVATRAYADKVSGWHDVTQIAAGAYSAGCLYGQGSMVSTHPGAQLGMGASLFGLSVCGPVSAALLPDGSLFSNCDNAPGWRSLTRITISQTGMIGVFSDGTCRGYTFRTGQDAALTIDGQVIEAASSGTHHIILTDDGRVFAFGDNGSGQCDVSDWRLE